MYASSPPIQFIGTSAPILELKEKIAQIAPSSETVLIEGETGTGKSLLARVIHAQSPRKQQPFIDVASSAFSKYLLESELFGHVKGAFTGAQTSRKGKFLAADGGTLLLDEIGDIGSNVQAKLVKIIEEKRFFPVGSDEEKSADVRLITATNQPLAHLVNNGKFRRDLYYRLSRLSLRIPPLRERLSDIPLLIDHILEKLSKQYHIRKRLSINAQAKLLIYSWPGNVRELESVLVGAFLSSQTTIIDEDVIVFQEQDQVIEPHGNRPPPRLRKGRLRADLIYGLSISLTTITTYSKRLNSISWKLPGNGIMGTNN